MIVLVDQDGPLADFEGAFFAIWERLYPGGFTIPREERTTFYIRDQFPETLRPLTDAVIHAPGFYRNLPPMPGALAAMQSMLEMGLDVRICTAPLPRYRNCVLEKYEWVDEHLGREFVSRMIVTPDKTVVRGAFLIDDKPRVTGALEPAWEHLLFDLPYNRHATDRRRVTWENWREVLGV